jgi:hypothetical protein
MLERTGNDVYPSRVAWFCVAEPPPLRLWDGEIQQPSPRKQPSGVHPGTRSVLRFATN